MAINFQHALAQIKNYYQCMRAAPKIATIRDILRFEMDFNFFTTDL